MPVKRGKDIHVHTVLIGFCDNDRTRENQISYQQSVIKEQKPILDAKVVTKFTKKQ